MNRKRIAEKIGKKLLFPHPIVVAMLALLAAAGLVYSFLALPEGDVRRIGCYALSAYALAILCARVPQAMRLAKRFRRENTYYLRYTTDVQLRMNISLLASFTYNAAYAVFQLALGLFHHSAWFYAMAGYYCLLAVLRLMLGRQIKTHTPGEEMVPEWRKYRLCGAGLLPMNLALTVFMLYYMRYLRVVNHHEITVIAMSAYTFGALTLAIVNVARYRRYESPACSAAKALSLASAMVSLLSLENAMLTTFAKQEQPLFRKIILGASGSAISIMILMMAVYMIVRATQNIKKEKENEHYV